MGTRVRFHWVHVTTNQVYTISVEMVISDELPIVVEVGGTLRKIIWLFEKQAANTKKMVFYFSAVWITSRGY